VAAPDRTGRPVIDRLVHDGRRFSFYQLVQYVMRAHPEATPPGGTGPASREVLRFRPNASFGFPASDVEEVEAIAAPGSDLPSRYLVTVNFMGLYGPASPLPNHFTEDILWGGTDDDAARDFVDLFNHRILSFLYRAWEKYRHAVQFRDGRTDAFTPRLLCLLGLGTSGLEEAAGLPLIPLLSTSGLFGARQRSAAGLEGVLRDHLDGIPVRVHTCVERWGRIPSGQQTRLGQSGSRLGEDTCLGELIRDRSSGFRITLGPMGQEEFRSFLPRGEKLGRLARLTRLYVSDPLDFDVELRLEAAEVPAFRVSLGADLPLGQMSWLSPRGVEEGRARLSPRGHDPLARRQPEHSVSPPTRRGSSSQAEGSESLLASTRRS